MKNIWLDILDTTLTKTGEGPISSAGRWEHIARLDKAGEIRAQLPATDARTQLVSAKLIAETSGLVHNAVAQLGIGVIDVIKRRVNNQNLAELDIEGGDILRELTYRDVGNLTINGQDGPQLIMAIAPAGWSLDTLNGWDTTATAVSHTFEGGSVLSALNWLAETTGEHFRLGSGRQVVWLRAGGSSSGLVALQAGEPVRLEENQKACIILDLEEEQETYELASRVIPYGSGTGSSKVTLSGTSWTPPGGYTLDDTNNYIKRDSTESSYGRIERVVNFKDIDNADTLAQAAFAWLERNSEPYKAYRLRVAKLDEELPVGSTIRVIYYRYVNGFAAVNIDAELVVLERRLSIDSSGIRTTELLVATVDRYPTDEASMIIDGLNEAYNAFTAPQPVDPGSVGTLLPSQYPDALLRDGSRSLLGNLPVAAGITVDGVDLDVHAGNVAAHHAPVTAGNTGIGVAGQVVSLALATGSGLTISSGLKIDYSGGNPTEIHPDDTADPGSSVYPARADHQHQIGAAQPGTIYPDSTAAEGTSSAFSRSDHQHAISAGTAVSVSVSTTNTEGISTSFSRNDHTHNVITSSDPGAQAYILASTSAGGLTLESFQSNGDITALQSIYGAASSLRAIHHDHGGVDHVHLVINPTAGWTLDEQFGVDIDDNLLVRGFIVGKHALQIKNAIMICHYDGDEPFEIDYSGSLTGHMGQAAEVYGAVIFRPGKFGKAVQVAEATQNLIINPSAEGATLYWTGANGGYAFTLESSSEEAYVGTQSFHFTIDESGYTYANANYLRSMNPSAGTKYTAHGWVKAKGQTIGKAMYLSLRANGGAQPLEQSATNFTASADWQWVTVTHQVQESDRTSLQVFVRFDGSSAAGDEIFFDGMQLEEKDYPTPLAVGDMGGFNITTGLPDGTGHYWDVGENNSISLRRAAKLHYQPDVVDWDKGTISLWYYNWGQSRGPYRVAVRSIGPSSAGGENSITIRLEGGGGDNCPAAGIIHDGTGTYIGGSGLGIYPPVGWVHLALTWGEDGASFYMQGELIETETFIRPTGGPDDLSIGVTDTDNAYWANTTLDDLLFVDRQLSADEIRAIYESNAPVFAETSTWQWRAAKNLVWADSEGLWMFDEGGNTVFGFSGVDSQSWGGVTLNKGDILFGRYGSNLGGWMWFDRDGINSNPFLKLGYADKTTFAFDYYGATIDGVLDISTSGGIYQGTGTFQTPTTGLKIWNESGIGRIAGYNGGGSPQWYAATDGRLYAGGGYVVLDSNGITVSDDLVLDNLGMRVQGNSLPTSFPKRQVKFTQPGVLSNYIATLDGVTQSTDSAAGLRVQVYGYTPTFGNAVMYLNFYPGGVSYEGILYDNADRTVILNELNFSNLGFITATSGTLDIQDNVEVSGSLKVQGTFGGGGLTVDSTTGAGITLDKGATDNWSQVVFATTGTAVWALGTLGSEDFSLYKSSSSDTWFKVTTTGTTYLYRSAVVSDVTNDSDPAVIFRSSDVNRSFSTGTSDTYGMFDKASVSEGGFRLRGFTEATLGFVVDSYATTGDTSTGASSEAVIRLRASKSNGAGGETYVGSSENIFMTRNYSSARMIQKGNGDLYIYGGNYYSFDEYDDIQMTEALDVTLDPDGVIRDDFNEFLSYDKDTLVRAKLINEAGDFINITQLGRLHNGAIRQLGRRLKAANEKIAMLENRLAQLEA